MNVQEKELYVKKKKKEEKRRRKKKKKKTLSIPHEKFKSVIVSIGDSKFKTQMPENVTQAYGYIRYIQSHTRPVLTNDEVVEIVRTIKKERLSPALKTHAEHVRHVMDIKTQKRLTEKNS